MEVMAESVRPMPCSLSILGYILAIQLMIVGLIFLDFSKGLPKFHRRKNTYTTIGRALISFGFITTTVTVLFQLLELI